MENFWKEYTVFLKAKKEYVYDIQNQNTNCVIVRNHNITNIKAGLKSHAYEVLINPNRTGLLNRPFPLNYVYLLAAKSTPVSVIETITQNPINNYIQQKISKNIIARNAPQVREEVIYKQVSIAHEVRCPPWPHDPGFPGQWQSVTLDCGVYGKPLVNIIFASAGLPTWFHIGFSNDNVNYFFPYRHLQNDGSPYHEGEFWFSQYYPFDFVRNYINLLNAFRYVRVIFIFYRFTKRGHRVFVQISGKRCHVKNNSQMVTQEDGF